MSRESQPEPILKMEQAKFDNSELDKNQNSLHQEAAKELSSPPSTKEVQNLTNKNISETQNRQLFKLHASTTPQEETQRHVEPNNQHTQDAHSTNFSVQSNKTSETSTILPESRKTENKPQVDLEIPPIQKIK